MNLMPKDSLQEAAFWGLLLVVLCCLLAAQPYKTVQLDGPQVAVSLQAHP